MAGFSFGNLQQALADTAGKGVSFEGKAKNWGSAEDAAEVVAAIDSCAALDFLNLEGNTLGVAAADAIARALEKHPEFRRALWKDLFTGRLKTEIPQALQSMGRGMITAGAQLSVLDCSDNALGPNGMRGLVDLLKSKTCYTLQELKLNNCGLGIEGGRMLAKSLTECHQSASAAGKPFRLRVFIAGRNRLENDGARALAEIFGRIGSLVEVAMPQNGINPDGIRALSEAFCLNPELQVLNLNDNTITPRGATYLSGAIGTLQHLREINLGDCLLKSGGAVLLGEALQDAHVELERLNLGFNEIGPNGGMSIAAAMQNKPLLETVVLNGNMFGSECRASIVDLMQEAGKLEALDDMDEDDSDNENAEDDDDDDDGADEEDDDEDDDDENEYEDEEDEYDDEDEEHNGSQCDISPLAGGSANQTVDYSFNLNDTSFKSPPLASLFGAKNVSGGDSSIANGDTPVETFCLTEHPTAALFNNIGEPKRAFRTYLAALPERDYLLQGAFAVLKLSAISALCPAALDVVDALYADCFAYAERTEQLVRLKTFFLTQLGLLRVEDRAFRPPYDVPACRSAIRHAIGAGSLSEPIRSAFELFLERF